ncbi:hypothetical protein GCM10009415_47800 [Chitinophaga japonensis]
MEEEELRRDEEMTQQYTSGEDELAPNVHVRHPNRNTAKGDEAEHVAHNEAEYAYMKRYDTLHKPYDVLQPESLPQRFTRDDFTALAAYRSDAGCVTFYLPTHRSGMEVNEQQDTIRYKNALQKARQQLLQKGWRHEDVESLLLPAFNLMYDDDFWRRQLDSIGLFLAPGFFKYIRLPYRTEERHYINSSFYVSPLLPLVTSKEHFYLLALSKNKATLYEADAHGIQEVPVPDMPDGKGDVVRYEGRPDLGMTRSRSAQGSGAGVTDVYSMGEGKPDEKSDVSMYVDQVEEAVWKARLHNEKAPLLLAAVEYIIPMYRERSRYRHIMDTALTGNYEHENPTVLYEKAREKMRPYFEQDRQHALDRYWNNSANGLTSSIPADVVPACYYSRVDTLFIQRDGRLWGAFNERDNRLIQHDSEQPGDECLVNAAAAKAMATGAAVFILEKEQMPAESPVAALMRY